MNYTIVIPYTGMKKGHYTVLAEMYATDGARTTGFEGTVWTERGVQFSVKHEEPTDLRSTSLKT
jgi:hypothetical protein